MSMAVDALLRGGRATNAEDPNPTRVLAFLRANPSEAWTAKEISDALDIQIHTLGAVLRRLRSRGLVDKQGTYWFIPTEIEGAKLTMMHAVTQDANERLGVEDPADWF